VVEILVYGHSNASTAMHDEPIGSLLIIVIAGTAVAIISGSKLTHHILLEREESRTK
jgi:hypothetical protein